MHSAKIIAIVNQKGGVGKTTTAINLSAALAIEGLDCLVVDCDPQGNTTSGLGIPRDEERASIYDLIIDGAEPAGILLPTEISTLKVLPGVETSLAPTWNWSRPKAERRG